MKTNKKLNESKEVREARELASRMARRAFGRALDRGELKPHPEHPDPARAGELAGRRDAADAKNGTITYWSNEARKYVVLKPSVIENEADPVEVVALEARAALEAIAGWASDEGPLVGKSPMDISAFAREAILKVNRAAGGIWGKV